VVCVAVLQIKYNMPIEVWIYISFGSPEQVGNMTWPIPFVFFTGQSLLHK
jgi:hypothetical protein